MTEFMNVSSSSVLGSGGIDIPPANGVYRVNQSRAYDTTLDSTRRKPRLKYESCIGDADVEPSRRRALCPHQCETTSRHGECPYSGCIWFNSCCILRVRPTSRGSTELAMVHCACILRAASSRLGQTRPRSCVVTDPMVGNIRSSGLEWSLG